ncbi:MAG: NAD(P)/FAD-dependent oxidoreductase [Bacteroidetes bacterium]|nr:NAD(P)/FAD-dependent oxidoreductase [Bacteroidota bacterium]
MQEKVSIKLLPQEADNNDIIKAYILKALDVKQHELSGFRITKKSIDARSKQPYINLTLQAYINEPFNNYKFEKIIFRDVHHAKNSIIIIGAGPAGLFAALKLIEYGIKPVIIERGKDVRSRRRDLATLNKQGTLNTESNYCFGEGGAGTYSDGKLYTRSNKRGSIQNILNLFAQFGADESILYESHPHIGTNKLPHIITAMRQQIEDCGGKILFQKKLVDFTLNKNKIQSISTADGEKLKADAFILATGHSARDIFILLYEKKIKIEPKPFALGVRIEHPQHIIDSIQYHCSPRDKFLPPAAYSLVNQVNGKGVFSFCMCPGGIIAPASTNNEELVVNGWSPSKRNNPYANSGIVVEVLQRDVINYNGYNQPLNNIPLPLSGIFFQQAIEKKAFIEGGGKFVAPAQRLSDFVNNKVSASLPECSYLPGIATADMRNILPSFIFSTLQQGFKNFGNKMRGYLTNEAVIVATESRTSSPVRIPRNDETFQHPQLDNLYPCGEGAGYAGGIVSAAMDGEKVATAIIQKFLNKSS